MTQYVQLSPDGTKVITAFGGPQSITDDKPGYAEVADATSAMPPSLSRSTPGSPAIRRSKAD